MYVSLFIIIIDAVVFIVHTYHYLRHRHRHRPRHRPRHRSHDTIVYVIIMVHSTAWYDTTIVLY